MKLLLVLSMVAALSSSAIAAQSKAKTGQAHCGADSPDYSRVVAYTAPTLNSGKTKSAK